MTTVIMGLYEDFQRAQRIGQNLAQDKNISLIDVAVLVKRDDPDIFQKYYEYFDLAESSEESDDDSLLDKVNPFSDDDDSEMDDISERNKTIIFVNNKGDYDADVIKEVMQNHNPIALTTEDEEAWIGAGWIKDAENAEDMQQDNETIEDRRYRSFDWEANEQA